MLIPSASYQNIIRIGKTTKKRYMLTALSSNRAGQVWKNLFDKKLVSKRTGVAIGSKYSISPVLFKDKLQGEFILVSTV